MNPRENLISLYRREGYAFVPVELGLCPAMKEKMEKAIGKGVEPADYFEYPEGFARAGMPPPKPVLRAEPDWRAFYPYPLAPDTQFSVYGVGLEAGTEGSFHMRRMRHPLAGADSLEQLQSYPWPEWDVNDISEMRDAAEKGRGQGHPVMAGMTSTIWECAWSIRDMAVLMADMADADPKASFILDKITGISIARAEAYARAGADVICMGDDVGMQNSTMMSRDMYREWLQPRLAQVIAAAKRIKPDVLIMYHSCGFVTPFIPDLMEAGVDILNPVQPECMDFASIHAEFGDRLSFNGTLGTQTTMPFGSAEDVRNTVRRNLDLAGETGGLVVCPTHVLEPEVPWENVEAYIRACKEYRG